MAFSSTIKTKYSTSNHDQKQTPLHYSSQPVKFELVVKHKPTSTTGEYEPTSNYYPDAHLVDIFKKEKDRKVLIEGGTGIGKTTFCSSISKDWENEEQFKVLLLLSLHEKRIAAPRSLPELIQVLKGVENVSASIADDIKKTNGEGVLIVADGWDELDAPQCSESFLCDLLFGRILELASIIVTSRPSYSHWLCEKGCFDRLLSICGFDDMSIEQYINLKLDFTNNQQESDCLLETVTVDSNPLLNSMCHIPLNCATLCDLWRTESRKQKLLTTMTELCTKMILNIVLRSIKKVDKPGSISHHDLPIVGSLPEELRSSWWDLCQLAFQTVQKSQHIDLSQFFKSNRLVKFGLVEIINKAKCDFLHPVIQEYLAALHVANLCHSRDTPIQDQLIQSVGTQVTNFWRFLFGICGQSKTSSNLALLECAIQSLSKLRCLICHCAFEAKNSMVNKKAIELLSTKSDSKDFGDPKTSHDCEAILYVIKQMRTIGSDAKLELNFKNCDFTKQQLRDLAEILTHDKIKVKRLDLSDKVKLPSKKVADLFNNANKALTAFQTLEILSLRNQIGKDAVYTMNALYFLKHLTYLDLSFNRLKPPGLKALKGTVERGSLKLLQILLLQKSLSDAKEILKTFAQSLLHHCCELQVLDISENELGEPGSPFVSDLICILTRQGLILHVDKKYELKLDKSSLTMMKDLVRQGEKIRHTVVHGIVVGPGRSGKNSLIERLMDKGPLDPGSISPSTGVLERVVKVEVKRLWTMDVATSLKWTKLEYDQEALELMMNTIITHIASLADKGRKFKPIPDLIPQIVESKYPRAVILEKNESENESENKSENDGESRNETESESEIDSDQEVLEIVPEVEKGTRIFPQNETEMPVASSGVPKLSCSSEFRLHEGPMDIFKRALKLRHMHALREHLESSWSLYLTNTGGQSEFQELLPLLVCGPSMFFVTFPLHMNLDKSYSVRYQYHDSTEISYSSSFTLMDEILQTLATIVALDCTGPKFNCKPIKPNLKVFFIGTHKDKLLDDIQDIDKQPQDKIHDIDEQFQKEIKRIDGKLQEKIKETSVDERISIEYYAEGTQLMFTVNNLDKGNCDFEKIRLAVQRMVDRDSQKGFTIPCPCSWLVFSLVLQAKHEPSRVLSYNDCFTVAQSCGISSKNDFHEALRFIHHELGLIRYFPIKGLNNLVIIDPHVMFDTISNLIVKTFISDYAGEREIKDLQKRGIFSIKAMRKIISSKYSDSQFLVDWILNLLNHLGIAFVFEDPNGERNYLIPCALCHAPKQQGSNISNCSIKLPPPISITFKGGFCPRGISGTFIKSLVDNGIKSWKLHQRRVSRNQITFSVGPADIILKILPTHIEVCFDPESRTNDQHEVNVTCAEAYEQIKRVMSVKFHECDYYFAFNCKRPECEERAHPAKINWDILKLECRKTGRESDLPDGYKLWIQIGAYQQGN